MLSPSVRGFGRNAVLQNTSCQLRRRIHLTSVRSADEGDKSPPPIDPEKSTANESSGPVNPQKTEDTSQQTAESNSLPSRNRESTESEQRPPPAQKEEQTTNVNDDTAPAARAKSFRLSNEEFEARRRERQQKLKEIPSMYNLPNESVAERNAKYRQRVYDKKKATSDEAALRGEQIFEEVNRKRKERGEPELAFYRDPNEDRGGQRGPASGSNRRFPDRTGPARGNDRNPGRFSRGKRDSRTASQRLQERVEQYQELHQPHIYSKNFDPSLALAAGHDEADFEIDPDEFPDPVEEDQSPFVITNRDGTVTPGRKTNRDYDELPEEEQIYHSISDLGGPSERSFYAPPVSQIEALEDKMDQLGDRLERELEEDTAEDTASNYPQSPIEAENAMEAKSPTKKRFDESSNTDIQELMKVKEEIETGMTPRERKLSRMERESDQLDKEWKRLKKEEGSSGQWFNWVPLPQPHKPETADLDDYVAPVFNHESFKYGIPALPFGSQGRLAAAREVSFDITEPFIPADLTPEKIAEFKEMQSHEQFQKSFSELADMLDEFSIDDIEDRPIPPFNRRMKVPNPPKSSDRPGPVYDFNREVQIEDLYSDTQMAIWREMHAGAFAPAGYKFPSYEEEEGALTMEEEMQEDAERSQAMAMVDTMEATALKMFRQRDEFEIRDIRRRLGLPIVNDTYAAEPYHNKHSLDVPSPEDEGLPRGETSSVLQGEIVNESGEKEPEIVDDTPARLQFWRDSKTYLASLAARISQLRDITQAAAERMRRHGTGQLIQSVQPGQQPGGTEVVEETPEKGLMATLHAQFQIVHKKLENLEGLATAVQLGPRGPLDPEWSDAWVEHNLHEFEKGEFEKTALKMGYPANSVTMEPEASEEQKMALEQMKHDLLDARARIGVGGEYREFSAIPGEGMPYPMNLAGRYAAKAGLDTYERGIRVWTMAQTFEKMGIPFDDPREKKDEEKKVEGTEKNTENEEAVGAEGEKGLGSEVAEALRPEDAAKAAEEDLKAIQEEAAFRPPVQDPVTANYIKIIREFRKSMSEIDKDVTSLESDYDAFLKSQQMSQPPLTPPSSPPQEISQ